MKSGYEAYGASHKNSLKGRALEAEAFSRAVHLLSLAQDFPGNNRMLFEAVDFVRKLWTLVEAELNSPACQMDIQMQSNLRSLASFVESQTIEITKKPHPHMLQGLIDIHKEIAAGLLSTS